MKKNIWTLMIGTVLAASLILSGCGSKAADQPAAASAAAEATAEEEENTLLGSYYAIYDATETMKEAMGEVVGELSTPIEMVFLLDLNEDETFNFTIDSDSFINTVKAAFEGSIDAIIANAMGMDELDEETKKLLVGESDYTSYEEFRQGMLDVMTEEMENQGLDEMKLEGKYTVNGNTISFAPTDDDGELPDTTIGDDGKLTMALDNEVVDGTLVFEKGTYAAE